MEFPWSNHRVATSFEMPTDARKQQLLRRHMSQSMFQILSQVSVRKKIDVKSKLKKNIITTKWVVTLNILRYLIGERCWGIERFLRFRRRCSWWEQILAIDFFICLLHFLLFFCRLELRWTLLWAKNKSVGWFWGRECSQIGSTINALTEVISWFRQRKFNFVWSSSVWHCK